ncbi:MAG: hypothetical protein M1482_07100 [Chloroflexi bacterium]|nr:hypothetical protein [Chloroflexota bacterium]
MTMRAQGRVGLKNQKRFSPVFQTGLEEDEPETIRLRKGRLVGLAVKDDQLLSKQSILGDEFGFTARKVFGSAENHRVTRGLGEMQESLFEE